MAVLAAVYAVGSYLPGFPMLGLSGSKIDLVRALEIGYGVVLGPVYGPITAFLGAIVGKTLTGGGVGLFFTPLAPVTAFAASMLEEGRVEVLCSGYRGFDPGVVWCPCRLVGLGCHGSSPRGSPCGAGLQGRDKGDGFKWG